MSWSEHHGVSEKLAGEAELLARRGQPEAARVLYTQAAEAEVQALSDLDPRKTRTLGITVVSAAALWFRAREYQAARKLAHQWLSTDQLAPFAQDELQGLLQAIWSASSQEVAGVQFVEGDVLVAVKGGQVVFGGAPLDLVVQKVEEVKNLFFRTAELLLSQPHRKRGRPSAEVQSVFQPWLFQAPAGSYQFAIRVEKPRQMDLFPGADLHVGQVVSTCLSILKASVEDTDGSFEQLVQDPDYQSTFLRLARNLAPTGDRFAQIEFRDPTRLLPDPVALVPESRKYLNEAIRAKRPQDAHGAATSEKLEGVLRAVHLDQDWIEVVSRFPEGQSFRIGQVGEVVDDVIGPMVNHPVIVEVTLERGRYLFRDIEPSE